MDIQDLRKNHSSSGHENHGVHLCHKCGWPFPNPHPSARHRRTHKRICGTIEGYNMVESGESTHSTLSDDEHLSDDDHKLPSPKLIERTISERGSGAIGSRSNRSEDEVFSDAVTEFSDSVSSSGIEEPLDHDVKSASNEVEKVVKDDSNLTLFVKDAATFDNIQQPSQLVDVQMKSPELLESVTDQLGSKAQSQDHSVVPGSSIDSTISFTPDCGTKEVSVVLDNDGNDSACDLNAIKTSAPSEASQQNQKTDTGDDFTDFFVEAIGQEINAKRNEFCYLHKNSPDISVLPSKNEGNISEPVFKLEDTDEKTSDPVPAVGVIQSIEEPSNELGPKMSTSDLSPEIESVEQIHAFVETPQVKVDASEGIGYPGSGDSVEAGGDRKGDSDENVYVLSVHDLPVEDNPEVMLDDFKDHKGVKLHQPVTLDSCGMINNREEHVKNPPVSESSLSLQSRQLSDGTEISFEDHEGVKSNQPVMLDSHAMINDSEEDVKVPPFSENNIFSLQSRQLSDDTSISSSDIQVVAPVNVEVTKPSNIVDAGNAGSDNKTTNETCDISENDSKKVVGEEKYTDNVMRPESASNASEVQVDEKISVPESREEPIEEKISMKNEEFHESASSPHESQVSLEDTNDGAVKELPETKYTKLDGISEPSQVFIDKVSDIQEGKKELESNDNVKTQEECAGVVPLVAEARDGGDVELLRKASENDKTSENQIMKEPLFSPLESSYQDSASVDKIDSRVVGQGAPGITYESVQAEGDDNRVKQQQGVSAIDGSIDSNSQTDSLEGHWGSVSVLSTQSDIPAIIDASNTKMPKPGEQHPDKPDIFEPPSFMTLVEHRGGADQKTDDETLQNLPQSKTSTMQAAWFPSLTHVTNDSQGRKKNEEIIAKVTNWSTGKQQHTPLKSLLGEATTEQKLKITKAIETPNLVTQKDEPATLAKTVNSILGPESPPTSETAKKEIGKEWNSPARYPSEIKREKRKVKGRPYWAQFMCCSSVN